MASFTHSNTVNPAGSPKITPTGSTGGGMTAQKKDEFKQFEELTKKLVNTPKPEAKTD
jgi:hypothetical protein